MPTVFCRSASYEYAVLEPLVFGMLDNLSGQKITPRQRVLIKPNLLAPATPDRAMLTHPLMVKAVVTYLNRRGVRPRLADSPAMGTFDKVLREGGFQNALAGLDVDCREFRESIPVDIGEPYKKIEISREALEADIVINLPKLKTHTHMLMTLGVKNLFGCIIGFRKPEWHLRAGTDRDRFAGLLVRIHDAIRPSITILDGILAMEGEGPGKSGTPRQVGILLGSNNAVALDFAVCRMLGIEPEQVMTNRVARQLGFDPSSILIDGILPAVEGFKLPTISPLVFGPKPLHGFIRRHLVQRPEVDHDVCQLCGECWNICPAKAISVKKKRLHFNYDACFRCYCCIEVCPHAALRPVETTAGKIIKKAVEHKLKRS